MKPQAVFALLVALALPAGCNSLTPKTYQLEQIHASYTAEWARSQLPAPGQVLTLGADPDGFKATLAAIHNYKALHGDDTRVAAHLTVLEGMIYLQSGQTGMAALVQPDVAAAKDKLESSSGVAGRDYLFASSFPDLVQGWTAVTTSSGDPAAYSGAADRLVATLSGLKAKQRAAAEVDSGGAYIATTAAILYLWSDSVDLANDDLPDMAARGAAALEPWLTAEEKAAVSAGKAAAIAGSRARYVAWYDWLRSRSAS